LVRTLIGVLGRAVDVFFFANTLGLRGFTRFTAALAVVRAPAVAFRAVFFAALRATVREAAVFFAAARGRLPPRRLAARFRPEARTAFRLAITWSLQP
jgi:hypothetical protein